MPSDDLEKQTPWGGAFRVMRVDNQYIHAVAEKMLRPAELKQSWAMTSRRERPNYTPDP